MRNVLARSANGKVVSELQLTLRALLNEARHGYRLQLPLSVNAGLDYHVELTTVNSEGCYRECSILGVNAARASVPLRWYPFAPYSLFNSGLVASV